MNIRSLFYLSLAVLATTVVPSVHAAQMQAPLVHLQLGAGEDAPTLKFYTKESVAILEKLLGLDTGKFAQVKEQIGTSPVTNLDYDKHEAIKILHAIESNKLTPETYAGLKAQETNNTVPSPMLILETPEWQSTKKALDTLKASHENYAILYNAMQQVANDSKDAPIEIQQALEQLTLPCYCYFAAANSKTSARQEPVNASAEQAKHDREALAWIKKLSEPTVTQETLEAADNFLNSTTISDQILENLVVLVREKKKLNTQKTEQPVQPLLEQPTPAVSQTIAAPAQQVPPITPTQTVQTQSSPAATQPAVVAPASVAGTIAQPAPADDLVEKTFNNASTLEKMQAGHSNLAPEQLKDVHAAIQKNRKEIIEEIRLSIKQFGATDIPYLVQSTIENKVNNLLNAPSKPAKSKSFFSAHPWVKYGTYLIGAAAVVYGGYRLYKHVNVNKLVRTARLWA